MSRLSFVCVLAFALGACAQSDPGAERAAAAASEPWLATMDAGDYEASWQASAALFRDTDPLPGWLEKAAGYRDPLGEFVSRRLNTTTRFIDPMGAPAGEYVIVVYDSRWAAGTIYETVSMQRQPDGGWLVAGYDVQEQ